MTDAHVRAGATALRSANDSVKRADAALRIEITETDRASAEAEARRARLQAREAATASTKGNLRD